MRPKQQEVSSVVCCLIFDGGAVGIELLRCANDSDLALADQLKFPYWADRLELLDG